MGYFYRFIYFMMDCITSLERKVYGKLIPHSGQRTKLGGISRPQDLILENENSQINLNSIFLCIYSD